MQASYRQMIAEHEQIEDSAALLLRDAGDDAAEPRELADRLGALAAVIAEHVAAENAIVNAVDGRPLPQPWAAAWQEGEAAFNRLRDDWIKFLQSWNATAIARDRPGFRAAAEQILGRLGERLQLETRAFYATALQVGAIALR